MQLVYTPKDVKLFKELEEIIFNILTFSINWGHTYIITNAGKGWVEHTASLLYPKISPLLDKICIISARNEFQKIYPEEVKMWKTYAFLNLEYVFDTQVLTNIICMGDSNIEIESSKVLSSKFKKS